MIDKKELHELVVGSYVWCGTRDYPKKSLRIMRWVTATQICIDWNGNGTDLVLFDRHSGRRRGGSWSRRSENITGIPSQPEIDTWNQKQARDNAARKDVEAADAKREARKKELEEDLPCLGSVTVNGDDKTALVMLYEIPIDKVAAVLRAVKARLND